MLLCKVSIGFGFVAAYIAGNLCKSGKKEQIKVYFVIKRFYPRNKNIVVFF